MIDSTGAKLLASWSPPGGQSINLAASSPTQLLLSTGGGALVALDVQEGGLVEAGTTTLPAEVACLDITPVGAPCGGPWPAILEFMGRSAGSCYLAPLALWPAHWKHAHTFGTSLHCTSHAQAAHPSRRHWPQWAAGPWM